MGNGCAKRLPSRWARTRRVKRSTNGAELRPCAALYCKDINVAIVVTNDDMWDACRVEGEVCQA